MATLLPPPFHLLLLLLHLLLLLLLHRPPFARYPSNDRLPVSIPLTHPSFTLPFLFAFSHLSLSAAALDRVLSIASATLRSPFVIYFSRSGGGKKEREREECILFFEFDPLTREGGMKRLLLSFFLFFFSKNYAVDNTVYLVIYSLRISIKKFFFEEFPEPRRLIT